jgi:hypothetical protein
VHARQRRPTVRAPPYGRLDRDPPGPCRIPRVAAREPAALFQGESFAICPTTTVRTRLIRSGGSNPLISAAAKSRQRADLVLQLALAQSLDVALAPELWVRRRPQSLPELLLPLPYPVRMLVRSRASWRRIQAWPYLPPASRAASVCRHMARRLAKRRRASPPPPPPLDQIAALSSPPSSTPSLSTIKPSDYGETVSLDSAYSGVGRFGLICLCPRRQF